MITDKRLKDPAMAAIPGGVVLNPASGEGSTGARMNALDRVASAFGDPARTRKWLMLALLSSLLTLLGLFWLIWTTQQSGRVANRIAEMRILSQEISRSAAESAVGGIASQGSAEVSNTAKVFDNLKKTLKDFNQSYQGLSSYYDNSDPVFNKISQDWQQISSQSQQLVSNQNTISTLRQLSEQLAMVNPEMQSAYNDVVIRMDTNGYPTTQVVLAKNQVFLLERIQRALDSVLSTDQETVIAGNDFSGDAEIFSRVLNGQINGGQDAVEMGVRRVRERDILETLREIQATSQESVTNMANVVQLTSDELTSVRTAAGNIIRNSGDMLNQLNALSRKAEQRYQPWLPALLLGLGLLGLGVSLARLFLNRAKIDQVRLQREADLQRQEVERRTQEATRAQDEMDRNQGAILRLLDELGDLADGDLTVNATVSEDFTGAIADSVNFAIDQLRILVSAINTTAVRVAESSQETQAVAMSLAEASEHQAQEIASASAAINEMAVSIDQVSTNAVESTTVAERSVQIAASGAEVVNRTIEGMDTIRGQIQETSKRIKRLGESSQEIGDIVSLINDIADQTNILALNAAIQASMAGEAGRGFAVVADEVQRLAERSANATRQIEGLVKTIQSDTNEAVISMEQTTAEVVRGAALAQDAGVALDKIQGVSRNLADLIQNISNAARQQAASAGHISNTMNVIQEITTQTTNGTIATARSVDDLADMAVELRERVSGFTLPDEQMV